MKVLQIVPDFELAGAQTMCENLTIELNKIENVEVSVCCLFNSDTAITNRIKNEKIKIYFLNKKKGFDFSVYKKIRKLVKEIQPDVIHTHRYVLQYVIPALLLTKYRKIPIIHTIHSIADKDVKPTLLKIQKRWFNSKKAIPVAISNQVKESIEKSYQIKPSDIPTIYNGIILSRCIEKDKYNTPKNIIHIGRFSDVKNHDEIIDIFNEVSKHNSNVYLTLIGDGELIDIIKDKVKRLGIEDKVKFLGRQNECYKYLNEADIFILLSKYEGMPMTLIEAMGTGLPSVVYNVGGMSDMVEDGVTGYVVNTKEEAIKKLEELSKNKKLSEKMGKNALKMSNEFSSYKMALKYIELYEKELKNHENRK